jgi:hypothetical protein
VSKRNIGRRERERERETKRLRRESYKERGRDNKCGWEIERQRDGETGMGEGEVDMHEIFEERGQIRWP